MSSAIPRASVAMALLLCVTAPVRADTFTAAAYNSQTNELVVTMLYQGTNPDHQFSVQWGTCRKLNDGSNMHQIVGDVLDSQPNDAAQQTFTKTVRFSMAGVNCRPAAVTLRTPPRYEVAIQIPE